MAPNANKRKSFKENTHIVLVGQVGGVCPRCDVQLMYLKAGKKNKVYEIAHIYPLNPTVEEELLLSGEERLGNHVDHHDNLIPMCTICHTKFDKPRTVEDYRDVLSIKKALIEKEKQRIVFGDFAIEEEIVQVIEALYAADDLGEEVELSLQPKPLDEKFDKSIANITKNKIRNYVTSYFMFVRRKLIQLDAEKPLSAELISQQVKTFYLKQARESDNQQEIFVNIVSWIQMKTKSKSVDGPEILAAFFIQNCEIFK